MAKKQAARKNPAPKKTKAKAKVKPSKTKIVAKGAKRSVVKAVQKAIASAPPQPYLTYKIDLVLGDTPSYRLAEDAIEVVNSRGEVLEHFFSLGSYLNHRGLDGWRLYGFFDIELTPMGTDPVTATRIIYFKEMMKPLRPAED